MMPAGRLIYRAAGAGHSTQGPRSLWDPGLAACRRRIPTMGLHLADDGYHLALHAQRGRVDENGVEG